MSSARTSEPHHRAGLVERHPGVLHQRAGRPRQGRHVGGAAAPQVELEAGFVQGFPELRLHQLRNRRHGQRKRRPPCFAERLAGRLVRREPSAGCRRTPGSTAPRRGEAPRRDAARRGRTAAT